MAQLNLSRRQFLKATSIAGITAYVAPFGSAAHAALFDQKLLTPVRMNPITNDAQFRVDGIAKVTGSKIFAFDIRSRDLPNWPQEQSHALILRATRANALYVGYTLSRLGADLKPDRIVTADDLQRDGIAFTDYYGDDMLLPVGKTPAYLGHAVAILIFYDFARFRLAKNALQFQSDVVQYGEETGPLVRDPWGTFRFVRVGGQSAYDEDRFSSLKDAPIFPSQMRKQLPVWPDGKNHGEVDEEGMYYAQQIRGQLQNPPDDWLVLEREYQTQSVDTSALEPDNANCWYEEPSQTMHMVVPTQSPTEVVSTAASMLAKCKFDVKKLVMHPCYTVGYGSKDHCNMPFYGLVCALYGDGRPVRLANDRYEHFQTSLKRHAFDMRYRMGIDRKSGLIRSFVADMAVNSGGRCNFSPSVAMVGATAAQSIYYIPQSDLTARADATRAVDCGSARGYGTLQSMAATEMMMDELAATLKRDPIEFRLVNVLKSGMKNTQGATPAGKIRADEILEKARTHPIWANRRDRKAKFEAENPSKFYGVGFACVQKDFGTGAESSLAKVEITPQGKVLLRHTGTEIGTGMSTSQALACMEWLGVAATDVGFAITDWPDLPMTSSGDPYLMSQDEQDKLQADPLWTPAFASPASASNSAFYYTHTTREACRVIFQHGLWPAAQAIWRSGIGGGQAAPYVVRREDARWQDGLLTANGMEGLTVQQLAEKAHEMGLVVGAVVHAFNRWQWTEADFSITGQAERLPLDGLAVCFGNGSSGGSDRRPDAAALAVQAGAHAVQPAESPNTRPLTNDMSNRNSADTEQTGSNAHSAAQEQTAPEQGTSGTATATSGASTMDGVVPGVDTRVATTSKTEGKYKIIRRSAVFYPPVQRNNAAVTYYTAMGSLAEIAVHRGTGQIELLNHHSIIECGNLLSESLVSGQIQGGIAMGIGHALYEHLPLYEDGPGDGTWNFNRYHLPLAKEVALWTQTAEILPPLSDTDPPKGLAEVVMIPIVAAIVNGIADATGQRIYSLPVTPEKIKEALA